MKVIPNEPLLSHLYLLCKEDGTAVAIHDHATQDSVTRLKFLSDILALRNYIRNAMSESLRNALENPDVDTYICLVMQTQYEQALAFMAMYALGATAVLLSPKILPEEAEYFITLSGATAIIASPACADTVRQIKTGSSIACILLSEGWRGTVDVNKTVFRLDSSPSMNPEKGLVLLLTSGTTGPPKGILHSRRSILAGARNLTPMWSLSSNDAALLPHSLLWIGGLSYLMGLLLGGVSVELCESVFSPKFFWSRIRAGGVSIFTSTPGSYTALRKFLETEMQSDTRQSQEFLKGIIECKILATGSGYLSDDLSRYWSHLRNGRPLISTYGSTELTVPFCSTSCNTTNVTPFCVGDFAPGAMVNLQDGEEGELRVKTDSLFKRYVTVASELQQEIFDENGFFRTGDMARREGKKLFILGRVSNDVIRSNSWMVYAPSIENVLLSLPGIDRAVVLGVTNDDDGQERIAALLGLKDPEPLLNGHTKPPKTISLRALQTRLLKEEKMPVFKLPTILRILGPKESIPTNAHGKIDKKKVREGFFNVSLKGMESDDTFEMLEPGNVPEVNGENSVPWRYWAWE